MKALQILSALYNGERDVIEVVQQLTNDDDSVEFGVHTFSPETLEWWAATYGLDNPDEVIDYILYGPFVEDTRPMRLPIDEAKRVHSDKIRQAKSRYKRPGGTKAATTSSTMSAQNVLRNAGYDEKYIDAASEDPYEVIKRVCAFDEEVIEVKRSFVSQQREKFVQEMATKQKTVDPRQRASQLREQLRLDRREVVNSNGQPIEQSNHMQGGQLPVIVLEKGKRRGEA